MSWKSGSLNKLPGTLWATPGLLRDSFTFTHFCQSLSRLQGPNEARSIKSMKNPIEPIGNRTHYLPTCSTVLQPTAPPQACIPWINIFCSCVLFSVIQNRSLKLGYNSFTVPKVDVRSVVLNVLCRLLVGKWRPGLFNIDVKYLKKSNLHLWLINFGAFLDVSTSETCFLLRRFTCNIIGGPGMF